MTFAKYLFAVCAFAWFFTFNSTDIQAQKTKSPQQIKILNNYGSIPFEDGETVITEVKFIELDNNYEEYDKAIGMQLPESDCWRLLRENRATINVDDKFYGYKVSKVVKLLLEWLSSRGYDRPEIVALGEKLPKNQMKLVFSVKRGAAMHVSEIRFDGNISVSNEEFVETMKSCLGDSWTIYDKRHYEFCAQKNSRQLMFSKGFFKGKIERVMPQLIDNSYVVKIEVHEGIRYRIGEIKIEGAKVFTEKGILEMFGQKEGDIADGKLIINFFNEKLKIVYAEKGYVLYDAEFEPEFIQPQVEGLDGIVNIQGLIVEGLQFKLARIGFSGIEKEKARELRELFSLKDGEIYSQSIIEEGIKKINEMKEFYFVDKDQDVEIRTSEETSDIELLIKLTKIEQ